MNDAREPIDGLPEYERMFAEYFTATPDNTVVMLNVMNGQLTGEEIIKTDLSQNVTQWLVECPGFFTNAPSDVFKYIGMIKACKYLLDQFQPDVIVMNDWFFAPVLKALDPQCHVVYIAHLFNTALNSLLGESENEGRVMQAQQSERIGMIDVANLIVCNSDATKNDIEANFPMVRAKTISIPLGVDRTRYVPMPNVDSRVILYMGRLDPQKGLYDLLQELDQFSAELKQNGFEFWVAGKGAYLQEVIDRHFSGELKYLNVLDQRAKLDTLKQVGYMVFPSVYEPWGLALNEGLATGKVCVVSPIGGHLEQVKNKQNGYIVGQKGPFFSVILKVEENRRAKEKVMLTATKNARDIREHFRLLMEAINEYCRDNRRVAV